MLAAEQEAGEDDVEGCDAVYALEKASGLVLA
jgi:hypothetical protein